MRIIVRNFLEDNSPGWLALGKLGESKLVRSSTVWLAIVPTTAKLFERIEDHFPITVLGHTFDIHPALPFSWQIFFFAAVFFTVGNLLYSWKCPAFLRAFKTPADFVKAGGVDQLIADAMAFFLKPLSGPEPDRVIADFLTRFAVAGDPIEPDKRATIISDITIKSGYQAIAFWHVQKLLDRYGLVPRCATALMYGSGLALTAVLLTQQINFVIHYIGSH